MGRDSLGLAAFLDAGRRELARIAASHRLWASPSDYACDNAIPLLFFIRGRNKFVRQSQSLRGDGLVRRPPAPVWLAPALGSSAITIFSELSNAAMVLVAASYCRPPPASILDTPFPLVRRLWLYGADSRA